MAPDGVIHDSFHFFAFETEVRHGGYQILPLLESFGLEDLLLLFQFFLELEGNPQSRLTVASRAKDRR